MNHKTHGQCICCNKKIIEQPDEHDAQCERCYLQEITIKKLIHEHEQSQLTLIESLAAALDEREHETNLHSKRVACHTLTLARHAGLDDDSCQQVYWGALLHDIGKIAVPDAILLKQGELDKHEWALMRKHPEAGFRILASASFLGDAANIVLSHEERFDGSGYPSGLRGQSIPFGARLLAVIDTLDAMTNDRSYRTGLSFDVARDEIARQSGSQFDPDVVGLFLELEVTMRRMVKAKCFTSID